ncbi:MAG: OsmC family protein [Candidatus Kariarchaeaceae archaeon]
MPQMSQKNHQFQVKIAWKEDSKTTVRKRIIDKKTNIVQEVDTSEEIRQVEKKALGLDIPETWGGKGDGWCSDELFAASLGNCLFATFYDFTTRAEVTFSSFTIEVNLEVIFSRGKYVFSKMTVTGQIKGEDTSSLSHFWDKSTNYCHLVNALESVEKKYSVRIN